MSDDPVIAAYTALKRELIARYGIGGVAGWLEHAAAVAHVEAAKHIERNVAYGETVIGFKWK